MPMRWRYINTVCYVMLCKFIIVDDILTFRSKANIKMPHLPRVIDTTSILELQKRIGYNTVDISVSPKVNSFI